MGMLNFLSLLVFSTLLLHACGSWPSIPSLGFGEGKEAVSQVGSRRTQQPEAGWEEAVVLELAPWPPQHPVPVAAAPCRAAPSSQHFERSHFGALNPAAPRALVAFPVPAEDKLALRPGRNAPALCLVGWCPCVNAPLKGVLFPTPSSSNSCCSQLGGLGCTWERQHFPACLMDTSVSI